MSDQASAVGRTDTGGGAVRCFFGRVFALDVRSLAILRMGLGGVIFADLLLRLPTLGAMYTDDGYMTRELSQQYFRLWSGDAANYLYWSFHWLSGSWQWQVALFALAGVFALMLMFGCLTRVATVASWLLIVSLHTRNPMILSSGDTLLKMVLFWSMFLPLGRVWSVDAWRRRFRVERPSSPFGQVVVNAACAGLVLQLAAIYFFPGLAKWNEVWLSGQAMQFVLRDVYATPIGESLLAFPQLLAIVSVATVVAEILLPPLLLSPWLNSWFRLLNLTVFWLFHIGILLAMSIGLFPIVCMIAWLALVPSRVWDSRWLASLLRRMRLSREVPVSTEPARHSTGTRPWRPVRITANVLGAILVVYLLLWHVGHAVSAVGERLSGWIAAPAVTTMLSQHYQMFGIPDIYTPWFVYDARLMDGSRVDLLSGQTPRHWQRPQQLRDTFPSHHWRRLHRNLVSPQMVEFRQPLADYFVQDWNQRHPPQRQVREMQLYCYLEDVGPNYEGNVSRFVWARYPRHGRPAGSLFEEMMEQLLRGDDEFFP